MKKLFAIIAFVMLTASATVNANNNDKPVVTSESGDSNQGLTKSRVLL
ncbi:MAG: hypothetical protein ACK4JX_01325 [Flavobacterium sp.]